MIGLTPSGRSVRGPTGSGQRGGRRPRRLLRRTGLLVAGRTGCGRAASALGSRGVTVARVARGASTRAQLVSRTVICRAHRAKTNVHEPDKPMRRATLSLRSATTRSAKPSHAHGDCPGRGFPSRFPPCSNVDVDAHFQVTATPNLWLSRGKASRSKPVCRRCRGSCPSQCMTRPPCSATPVPRLPEA